MLKVLIFGDPHFFRNAEDSGIRAVVVRMETDDVVRRGPVAGDMVVPVGLHHAPRLLERVRRAGFDPDFIFLGDESRMMWLYGLEEIELPLLWYAIDTHIHHKWHIPYSAVFDYIFFAQSWYAELFEPVRPGGEMEYIPLFAPSEPPPMGEKRTIEAAFVGTLDKWVTRRRAEFFQTLSIKCPLKLEYGAYQQVYSRAKIVVNHASHNEINFRVFEAMYCGALLVTDRVPGIEKLFTNGRHLALFEPWSVEDAALKINAYLADEEERKKIAWDGQRKVLGNHLAADRLQQVIKILSPRRFQRLVKARMDNLKRIKAKAGEAYRYFAGVESLPAETRKFFTRLADGM